CEEHAASFPPARLLHDWQVPALQRTLPCAPLHLATTGDVRTLACALACEADFAQRPHWHGAARETGPWARQRHPPDRLPATAWERLAARWRELVELSCAGENPLLQQGALRFAAGEAVAWCEMARGLLLHWVRLDACGRVRDYRVLAPTEWNFHPEGALARALERLDPSDTTSSALLGAAFDACVPCTVASEA
ncbi:MAG TPA: nickel-dependent hydrogenase large subunit, partial [Ramlibacter sp.]|uniref:nickel-dependent hydrogenase large subunit n=1 Tax=Ramlibacter sp. TaxID=1917967 RepID=UPI002D81052A